MVNVEIIESEGRTLCRPTGELDASTVADFRAQMAGLASGGDVVIDLSGVPFMDSAGLGALIGGIRKVRESGGEVAVVCEHSAVLRLFHTTRFDRMVAVVADFDAAIEMLDQQVPGL